MAYLAARSPVNATFLRAKDTVVNASPVDLITIHVKDASATLYYANTTDGDPITYYKPGTSTSQIYTPAPFSVGEVDSNIKGEVGQLELTFSNIDRTIGGYLHSYDGVRGGKVNVIKVFRGGLNDPDSNMTDTYYIDSAALGEKVVKFTLTSKFNVQTINLPLRSYRRDMCTWEFKSTECGYSGAETSCNKTINQCKSYGNDHRFGGFLSIPRRVIVYK